MTDTPIRVSDYLGTALTQLESALSALGDESLGDRSVDVARHYLIGARADLTTVREYILTNQHHNGPIEWLSDPGEPVGKHFRKP